MEPPKGFLATLWNFFIFLPFFIGLLLLGIIKGLIFCPLICLIMAIGNSAIIIGLWPAHCVWTYYRIVRANRLGPILKLVLCICITVVLILWPVAGIAASIIGGAAYGLFAPVLATFKAVGEGKANQFFHCIYDGTWSTVEWSVTIIRDFLDVCFHSYFSVMDELQSQGPPEGQIYEIRLLYLPGAVFSAVLGMAVDMPVISLIAFCKSPYMLFKGWHRLFHDLIGREGPFLETICVPFAGLAILLWPLAVVGAVLGSMASSMFLGAYAGVVAYQESSLWLGLCYIIASLSLYDEYSNDVLDMREGSCFPSPLFRKKAKVLGNEAQTSFSRISSFQNPLSNTVSFTKPVIDLNPLELLELVFKDCQHYGEIMTLEGLITLRDIEDSTSKRGCRVVSIGLPSYCLLKMLLRSAKSNLDGLLLKDGITEINSTNRPRDTFFDWFLNPLLIMKEQIKSLTLSEVEEDYLSGLVLFSGDPLRLNNSIIGSPPESERRQAELDALARRLRGIMVSISRYPTFRRRFDMLAKGLHENLAGKDIGSGSINGMQRPKVGLLQLFSLRSFKSKNSNSSDPEC